LVEALGMGRPAVSLCGGPVPHGFAGSFGLPDIINVMPHVTSSDSLLKVLVERAGNELNLAAWRHEIQSLGKDFFSDGFSANTVRLIDDMMDRDRCGETATARAAHAATERLQLAN
jgi:hypothetical protein